MPKASLSIFHIEEKLKQSKGNTWKLDKQKQRRRILFDSISNEKGINNGRSDQIVANKKWDFEAVRIK